MECYNQFVSEWVKEVKITFFEEITLVMERFQRPMYFLLHSTVLIRCIVFIASGKILERERGASCLPVFMGKCPTIRNLCYYSREWGGEVSPRFPWPQGFESFLSDLLEARRGEGWCFYVTLSAGCEAWEHLHSFCNINWIWL